MESREDVKARQQAVHQELLALSNDAYDLLYADPRGKRLMEHLKGQLKVDAIGQQLFPGTRFGQPIDPIQFAMHAGRREAYLILTGLVRSGGAAKGFPKGEPE